ncbi:shikimate dehydrogenase family protein [Granulicella cerasi]|uniref:Shikimate dehydrogenase family protein n=1 Tax=Granulicella cerasi TaxID=741063 RepID=A0ABW1Z609_9BACT|nr:hypothetical protein [Granulicella cerasi]
MFELLSGETLLYPILGDPISFVKSPQRLTAKFAERKHNGACVPMLVPEDALSDLLRGIAPVSNVRGLLVTMPHKGTMFQHCATASETSKLLGVVSIVRRNEDGSWHGDMLDGLAFVQAQKMGQRSRAHEFSRLAQEPLVAPSRQRCWMQGFES